MNAISSVDALKWVRSQPTRFFNRERPDGIHLLAYIMADVLQLGKGECLMRIVDEWHVIGSNANWLAHEKYGVLDLFRHVVPAPSHGEHSMRGEILVGAFASDVAVVNGDEVLTVQGHIPPGPVLDATRGMKQALAFRLEQHA